MRSERDLVRLLVPLLFFLSGFTALVYEVLWLKELGVLFGNAAHAAATTLAVFFLGLAAGGYYWGGRAARLEHPLRTYGLLEIGIAASGLLYFGLTALYTRLYTPMYGALEDHFVLLLSAKFLLALLVLLPPAFLMGGTFPVLGQFLVRSNADLGSVGSFLYGINTCGAALGALAAGFFLPPLLGFRNTYLAAVGLSFLIGWIAYRLVGRSGNTARDSRSPEALDSPEPSGIGFTGAYAFAAGFLALGLQVVWTRMFSQVLQNSVYTFSAILVVFLTAIGAGAVLANRLNRYVGRHDVALAGLLSLAGLSVAASPFLFFDRTEGMSYLGAGEGWSSYITSIFGGAFSVLLIPAVLIGAIFPFLLRFVQDRSLSPGFLIGRLTALNTAGAILGSLFSGFLLLSWVGLWGAIQLLALSYFILAFFAIGRVNSRHPSLHAVPLVGLILLFTFLDPKRLPVIRVGDANQEQVLETWEGSYGVVAVVERENSRRIKVNNFYSLGGTASLEHEQNQSLIPLMTHPSPDSLYFLGMGTGITAGASLRQSVEHIVVTELVPEVITAAEKYFNAFTGGLFNDPRAVVLARDGRNHLAGSESRYDLIIADLFIPWKAGTGSLYSIEHYRTARSRLRPGGMYVQWIPMYQVTHEEFEIIARTMLNVFPQVTMWRGDFFPTKPILALVGTAEPSVLDPAVLVERGRALDPIRELPTYVYDAITLPFYAGNLSAAASVLAAGPVNSDDQPIVEYRSPINHRAARSGAKSWFVGEDLTRFFEAVLEVVPPERDPYLANLDQTQKDLVWAGLTYHRASVARYLGREVEADLLLREFLDRMPVEFTPSTDDRTIETEFPG